MFDLSILSIKAFTKKRKEKEILAYICLHFNRKINRITGCFSKTNIEKS